MTGCSWPYSCRSKRVFGIDIEVCRESGKRAPALQVRLCCFFWTLGRPGEPWPSMLIRTLGVGYATLRDLRVEDPSGSKLREESFDPAPLFCAAFRMRS